MKTFTAIYTAMKTDFASLGQFRTLEAHANTWREAAKALPRYIYPAGRKYRRISGPAVKETNQWLEISKTLN